MSLLLQLEKEGFIEAYGSRGMNPIPSELGNVAEGSSHSWSSKLRVVSYTASRKQSKLEMTSGF